MIVLWIVFAAVAGIFCAASVLLLAVNWDEYRKEREKK